MEGTGARLERRWRRHETESRVHGRIGTGRSAPISSTTASTTSWCRARRRCFSSITSPPDGCRRMSRSRSSRAWRKACQENGCALLGGETAEMPGFYADGEYDVAGFIVGAVDRAQIIDGRSIAPGDVLIGLPSNGLHTNGYSLARKIAFDELKLQVGQSPPGTGRDRRRCVSAHAPLLSAGDQTVARPRTDQGHGAYHRRWNHR